MKTKILALTALIALATSCSKSDEASAPSNFPADGVIRVATNVDALQTRAGMTTENIENFNLKIVNAANANYSYYAYCVKSAGEWIYYKDDQNTLQTLLWQNSTQSITVTAVSNEGSNFTEESFNKEIECHVQPDQSTESKLKQSDWLYMPSTAINPATDLVGGKLPITFKHLLSKVDLSVKLGTEFNITPGTVTNPITDLKVNGTKTGVKWNPSTNSAFDFTGSRISSITAYHNAAGYVVGNGTTVHAVAKYECILLPQTVAANDFTVTFKIGDKEYKWTSPNAVTVESGKQYTLALTAGKGIVTAGTLSTTNWTDGGTSDKVTD